MVQRSAVEHIVLTDNKGKARPLAKTGAPTWGSFNDRVARSLGDHSQACATPLPHFGH
jgi:hypothetical protein